MGLTLAEGELTKLDAERVRDRNAVEKERACAEQIIAKIEEVLWVTASITGQVKRFYSEPDNSRARN